MDHHAGLRHRGGPGRGPAAARHPGAGRAARPGAARGADLARPAALPLADQRGRLVQRPDRPDARRRVVHHHAAARRADRVRQAGPAAALSHPAAGADGTDQGRAGRAHRVRERAARPDRRGRRGPGRHGDHGGRAGRAAGRRRPARARTGGRGRHGHICRIACRHRAPGLPDPGGREAALRVRGRDPVHRPVRLAGHRRVPDRPAWCGRTQAGRPGGDRRAAGHAVPRPGRPRPYQDAARIAADPEYGRIVCHCERVSRGEIRDALASTLPPADLDGLRRRTRACNGRCQGFYCAAAVSDLLGSTAQ